MTFLITLITTRVIPTKSGRHLDYSFFFIISKVPTDSSSETLELTEKNNFAVVPRSPGRTRNEVGFFKVKET